MMELLKRAMLIWLGFFVLALMNGAIREVTREQILRTYDVTRGDLWALVLAWVAVLPLVLLRWRGPAQQL